MNNDVIITCAVTGAADAVDKHPDLPVTPKEIASAAIEAAKAGAAGMFATEPRPTTGPVPPNMVVVDLAKSSKESDCSEFPFTWKKPLENEISDGATPNFFAAFAPSCTLTS